MATKMRTAEYKAPSNIPPSLLVVGLALVYPALLARRIYYERDGIRGLSLFPSLIWFLLYLLQLHYYTLPFLTSPLNVLPRPSDERPLTGNLLGLIKRQNAMTNWSRTVPNKGLIHIRGILHITHAVMVTSPAALMDVLNTHSYDFQKPAAGRKFLTRVLGTGLIVAEGPTHSAQRRAVAPAFQGKHVRELVPLFWAKSRQMADVLAAGTPVDTDRQQKSADAGRTVTNVDGKKVVEVEIINFASRATLDIIGKAAFGRDFNTIENSDNELAKNYEIIMDPNKKGIRLVLYFVINVVLPRWLGRQVPWKMNQRINQAAYRLRGICRKLIQQKRQDLQQEKAQKREKADSEIDILSVLMRKQEIDEDGLVNQMLTFLAAGKYTTQSYAINTDVGRSRNYV